MEVQSFEEIAAEFRRRVNRTVWCTVATVDRQGRPRTRILHPIWDGTTGYILTNRDSFKAKHLARNPYVSLSYWDPNHEQVYIDCRAEWDDAPATKSQVWVMFKAAEPPMAYDPGTIWTGVDDPRLGVMKLTPWRIELFTMADLPTGTHQKVWHA